MMSPMVETPGVTDPATTPHAHEPGHGNSVAAWTAVAIILVGTLVMALAVIFTTLWVFVVGVVVVVLGVLAGKVLGAMGFGATH